MKMQFENPSNGYVEEVENAWLCSLIFGAAYFAYKGAWVAAILAFVGALFTFGVTWLIMPIFADDILRTSYLRRGWKEVTTAEDAPAKPKPRSADHERKLAEARRKMGL